MSIKDKKEKLRQAFLGCRSRIPEKEYLLKSARICTRLKELNAYRNAETIHCYVSMNERQEVNTHPLIKSMLAAGKKVVVPVTEFDTSILRHIRLEKFSQLQKNKWGVLEPSGGEEVPPKEFDLVIVPMVGGDRRKNRIGYGKGFYDRFLENITCPKVGLLFEACLIDEIPVERFDVPLSKLITETKVIE